MAQEMTEDEIVDAIVAGQISDEEAVRKLVANGRTEEHAWYLIRSLATVDVKVLP